MMSAASNVETTPSEVRVNIRFGNTLISIKIAPRVRHQVSISESLAITHNSIYVNSGELNEALESRVETSTEISVNTSPALSSSHSTSPRIRYKQRKPQVRRLKRHRISVKHTPAYSRLNAPHGIPREETRRRNIDHGIQLLREYHFRPGKRPGLVCRVHLSAPNYGLYDGWSEDHRSAHGTAVHSANTQVYQTRRRRHLLGKVLDDRRTR